MIIDTTNDELLINGQRWQRGGYLLATAYATDQINITARDGRVIGKAIEWDRILDKDKNTFGLDRDGTVTALTNIFNSQVKSPYKIDALRDVEDGTASYGEIMIYRSPGEWQYEVLEQYHGAYDSEAATLRSGATATLELYYTAQADGDGISELSQSNTPASGYQIIRKLYYAERAQQDPDTGTWVQFADLAANTSFNDAKNTLLAYLKERTGGTVPISLKMTWEEVEIYNGLLDSYGGAAAAYSVRRLSSAYTGPLIEVERASDSTTQDIGYDANGDLDTTALATFCSGTTCTVRTWYDQSSNGNDAVQTTQANQPTIYTGGAVVLENGEPALDFDGSDDYLQTGAISGLDTDVQSSFNVVTDDSGDTSTSFAWRSSYTSGAGSFSDVLTGLYKSSAIAFHSRTSSGTFKGVSNAFSTNQALISTVWNASDVVSGKLNGVDFTVNNTTGADAVPSGHNFTRIGANTSGADFYWQGTIQEVVLYASDETSNRSGIETNINDYFGIYTPFTTGLLDDYGGAAAAYSLRRLSSTYTGPLIRVRRASDNAEQDISADIEGNLNTGALAAFCSGTNGFLKTWYCQSGNGNDAEQTTTGSQPKIYDSSTGVVLDNANPAVSYDTSSKLLEAALAIAHVPLSVFIVQSGPATQSDIPFNLGTTASTSEYTRLQSNAGGAKVQQLVVRSVADGIAAVNASDDFNQGLITIISKATNDRNIGVNGGTFVNLSTSVTTVDSTFLKLGGQPTELIKQQEIIIYPSDRSTNRSGIETNINDYYSIY